MNDFQIVILLLNKTHLFTTQKFKIPNFNSHSIDRVIGISNSTATFVCNQIMHHQVIIQTNSIEYTIIHLNINNQKTRSLAVYKSPAFPFRLLISTLLDGSPSIILAGALNSKHPMWHSRRPNSAGQNLYSHMITNSYIIIAPDLSTYYPDQHKYRPDDLEIAILKNIELPYEVQNLDVLTSDHNLVI